MKITATPEGFLLPSQINHCSKQPVWSLAETLSIGRCTVPSGGNIHTATRNQIIPCSLVMIKMIQQQCYSTIPPSPQKNATTNKSKNCRVKLLIFIKS